MNTGTRFAWLILALLLISMPSTAKLITPLPGEPTDWNGFAKHTFEIDGRSCYVVAPKDAAPGNPWVWRARFPNFHAEADLILLKRGLHVAYLNTDNLYASDQAMQAWDAFYDLLTQRYGLSKRPAVEGVSRGGLFVYRWAARHPDRVACIYADTPVCDIKSWPLGQGTGLGSPRDWQRLLQAYELTHEQALAWDQNPIDLLEPIAQAGIPILHIVSLNDKVVPPAENTFVLAKRYRELGGAIDIIEVNQGTEKSQGHHFPHPDPLRVADFIERHASATPDPQDYFHLRGTLDNCRIAFEKNKRGKVVFVGGSITAMDNGWRDMTCAYLQQRFPETDFTFVNAGISSTGSPFGAFRMLREALSDRPADLVFEEAAVNDLHIGHDDTRIHRGMEGILRRLRTASPTTDVVVMHFIDPRYINDYRSDKTPRVIGIHEAIAQHYAVPTIHLAREVTERIDAGQLTWEDDFKDLHPSAFGHRLYAGTIRRTLAAAWDKPLTSDADLKPHAVPQAIDPYSYSAGRLIQPSEVQDKEGFEYFERYDPREKGIGKNARPGFFDVPMLVGDQPGDRFDFTFTGRGIAMVLSAGRDGAIIEHRIDQGPWQTLDLMSPHKNLYLPRLYVLADELDPDKPHTLSVRITDQRKPGTCNIVYLAVNE